MPDQQYYLRIMSQAEKEAVVTVVAVNSTQTLFTSQLALGYKRKNFSVYNSGSEVCYYSYNVLATDSVDSMKIAVGAWIDLPVSTDIPVYFFTSSGTGELRVEELA